MTGAEVGIAAAAFAVPLALQGIQKIWEWIEGYRDARQAIHNFIVDIRRLFFQALDLRDVRIRVRALPPGENNIDIAALFMFEQSVWHCLSRCDNALLSVLDKCPEFIKRTTGWEMDRYGMRDKRRAKYVLKNLAKVMEPLKRDIKHHSKRVENYIPPLLEKLDKLSRAPTTTR